jgi:hypothetical protein
MAVVCEDDAAHGVEQHLQHGLGAEAGSNDVGNAGASWVSVGSNRGIEGQTAFARPGTWDSRLRSGDVGHLSFTPNLPITAVGVCAALLALPVQIPWLPRAPKKAVGEGFACSLITSTGACMVAAVVSVDCLKSQQVGCSGSSVWYAVSPVPPVRKRRQGVWREGWRSRGPKADIIRDAQLGGARTPKNYPRSKWAWSGGGEAC